jgi:hypothetical protein
VDLKIPATLLDETWFVDVPQELRIDDLTQRHQQFCRTD